LQREEDEVTKQDWATMTSMSDQDSFQPPGNSSRILLTYLDHACINIFNIVSEGQDSGHQTAAFHLLVHARSLGHGSDGAVHRGELMAEADFSGPPSSPQRTLMCRLQSQRQHHDLPASADDEFCRDPSVGALTASVMTALAVADGIVCE
jgi:hypothetical protein